MNVGKTSLTAYLTLLRLQLSRYRRSPPPSSLLESSIFAVWRVNVRFVCLLLRYGKKSDSTLAPEAYGKEELGLDGDGSAVL